ncbi:hypothetical protein ONZ45_g8540 [Pleurotus djamor]|nr:hypothetical protein ONZ45_g8540 [Pleurotus djamor]
MFAKVQKFFARKASTKVLPTPPMMCRRDSDDKTLVDTGSAYSSSPKSSTSTLIDLPAIVVSDLDIIQIAESSKTHDRWDVIHLDTGKQYQLRSSINDGIDGEDNARAKVEAEVYETVRGDEHFVQMTEKWDEGRCAYQLTERFPTSLEDVKEELPSNAERTQLYAAHMVHALATLHQNGIAHNDVKLSNVFLNASSRPVLGGMGKAQVLKTTLTCEEDFVDFHASPHADGGYFHFKREVNKNDFVEDIRGLCAAIYEMHTGETLKFDEEGSTSTVGHKNIPSVLHDLLDGIFGEKTSPLKTDMSSIQSHPYFSSIDWNEIAFPTNVDWEATTPVSTPIEITKTNVFASVYNDIPDIDCDWKVSYSKPRSSPLPLVEVDIMNLEIYGIATNYTPAKGIRLPKYFGSVEEEGMKLGSSFDFSRRRAPGVEVWEWD